MADTSKLKNYSPNSYPQIPGAEAQYFNAEFAKIKAAINSVEGAWPSLAAETEITTLTADLATTNSNVSTLTTEVAAMEGAWTPFTPVVNPGTGAITSYTAAGRYQQIGKTVRYNLFIQITTNGTGATSVNATLPVLANTSQAYVFAGRENAVTGAMLQGYIAAAGYMSIFTYANAYPGGNGTVLVMSGAYEAA